MEPRDRFFSRLNLWGNAIILIGLLTGLVINSVIIQLEKNRIVSLGDAPEAPVVIILGAAVLRDKTMSPVLADRAEMALSLYKAGKAQKILVSGASQSVENDEVSPVRRYLVDEGVAPEDVFLDHAGFTTYDTMYRAKHIFGVNRAIIVSQQFHLSRALFIAHALGIQGTGVAADVHDYAQKNYLREWLARPYAVLQVLLGRPASILGEPFSLSGDGQDTWYGKEGLVK